MTQSEIYIQVFRCLTWVIGLSFVIYFTVKWPRRHTQTDRETLARHLAIVFAVAGIITNIVLLALVLSQ